LEETGKLFWGILYHKYAPRIKEGGRGEEKGREVSAFEAEGL